MEHWNEILNFTLKAINTRASLKKNGELEAEEGEAGASMKRSFSLNNFCPLS
jgi:hypothetical protein